MFGKDPHRRSTDGHEGRISTVEVQLVGLGKQFDHLESNLTNIIKDLSTKMDENNSSQKTDWSVVLAGIGVLITIMILAFTPLIYKLQENTEDVSSNEDVLHSLHSKTNVLSAQLKSQKENTERIRSHQELINQTAIDIAVMKSRIDRHQSQDDIHDIEQRYEEKISHKAQAFKY